MAKKTIRDRVLRALAEKYATGRKVLELGCGEGHHTATLFDVAAAVHGVDISAVAIARCAARGLSKASFEVADFLHIDMKGYDVISAIECIYYLSRDEQSRLWEKVAREHHGIVVLSVPITGGQYFTDDEVRSSVRRVGLNIIERRNLNARHFPLKGVSHLPLGRLILERLPDFLVNQRAYVIGK